MEVRIVCVFVAMFAVTAHAIDNNFDAAGLRVIVRVLDDCINSDGLSTCLKKKALTFINRLSRMDKLPLTDEILIVKSDDNVATNSTELHSENSLPRGADSIEGNLDNLLMDKITSYVSSRTIQVTMPKLSELVEEGRGKKMKGMMGGMMMGMAAKMMAMIPMAIAGLFLLAGKALITSKIALLLAGIIAIKKLVASKGGGGGGHGGWQSGGGGGGWHGGGGGGGWDKRSFNNHDLPYKAYIPPN